MALNLDVLLINIVVQAIIGAPVLWLVGKAFVGSEKAKFTDALWISALGTVISGLFGAYFSGILAVVVQLAIPLFLIKHFFDAKWTQAIIISVANLIAWIIISIILGLIGFAIYSFIF